MALDLTPNPSFAAAVDRLYAGLMLSASPDPDRESGLGGKLLYAGQLDAEGRALVVAGQHRRRGVAGGCIGDVLRKSRPSATGWWTSW